MSYSKDYLPRLLLTAGEPAGIGPDLCAIIAQQTLACSLTVVGDPSVLAERAGQLQLPLGLEILHDGQQAGLHRPGRLWVKPVKCAKPPRCGELDAENARAVLETIRVATLACMSKGFDGLVTNPVHKGIINEAGIPFTGHTEYIAELTGGHPVMMLATEGLRVALATTHLPLKDVSSVLTQQRLKDVLMVLHEDLTKRFGIRSPRILVCGLNPHAGEGGHLGREEMDVIEPVLAQLRAEGMLLVGPLPADTVFLPKYLKTADAVLAMYHDQGLPVLKFKGFGRAANITLGLPVVRTSVDHGTALDLAGKGGVDSGSLETAIQVAIEMATASNNAP